MKRSQCAFEEKIVAASRSGQWNDGLRAHVAGCRVCEELALVVGYLSTSAESSGVNVFLPDAGRLWQAAQRSARAAAMERALRPIVWARRIAFGTCAAALIAAIISWRLPLGAAMKNVVQPLAFRPASDEAWHGNLMLLITAAFVVLLVPVVFDLYYAWSED
jgi:hypothetical protein